MTDLATSPVRVSEPDEPASPISGALVLERLTQVAVLERELEQTHVCEDEGALAELGSTLELELERTVQLLASLERLPQEPSSERVPASEPELAVEQPTSVRTHRPTTIGPALADVCFVGSLDLTHAVRALRRARTSADLLVQVESGLRKMRRTLAAVFDSALEHGATELSIHEGAEHRRRHSDLEAGLAVRRIYSEFRRALRRPHDHGHQGVAMALRYAAFALATLFGSPVFERARVSDRNLLRQLHQRLLDWAHSEGSASAGRELLDDIFTSGDLLRGINRRQELRAHDAQLLAELSGDSVAAPDAYFARLDALFGLDDELDALIVRASREAGPAWAQHVRGRLAALCHAA